MSQGHRVTELQDLWTDWRIEPWLHPECSLIPLLPRTNFDMVEITGTLLVRERVMRLTVQKVDSRPTRVWSTDGRIEINPMVLESCLC